ncbi:MAG: ABC transporter substrate-binding protein [Minisyncoccota bacterium]
MHTPKPRLRRLFQALRTRDKILVLFFLVLGIGSLVFWMGALYVTSTVSVPKAGGEYIEGIVAQPRYINPILSQTSGADADLSRLIYSSLFAYDTHGALLPSIAQEYTTTDEGKLYTVTLRQGIKWHDGQELTADDVVYTIKAIQDPVYRSPLRTSWLSVDVASLDRYTVTFSLKKSYVRFLDNLTVGILPKHIWENISPENFLLADYNLTPIGSGPYYFFDSEKDSNGNMLSYKLRSFEQYFEGAPYITRVTFHFYPDEPALIDAYERKEIMGMGSVSAGSLQNLEFRKSTHIYEIAIPRLFGVFFNVTKSVALADDTVREALNDATDRERIVHEILFDRGQPAYSSSLPFMQGYDANDPKRSFNLDRANTLLDDKDWKRGDDGVRFKNGTALEVEIMVPDWPELLKTAEALKIQWEQIGARVTVQSLSASELQRDVIRPREYSALLFGEAAMLYPDPYSFWHSSQKNDPGLNLALFDNKEADDILMTLREELNAEQWQKQYQKFQDILYKENPAVFLYSPSYLYVMNNSVKGVDVQSINAPSFRLSHIKDWYINTKRVKK